MHSLPACPACNSATVTREIVYVARDQMHVRASCACGFTGPDPRVTTCATYGVRTYSAPYRCELCGDFHPRQTHVLARTP